MLGHNAGMPLAPRKAVTVHIWTLGVPHLWDMRGLASQSQVHPLGRPRGPGGLMAAWRRRSAASCDHNVLGQHRWVLRLHRSGVMYVTVALPWLRLWWLGHMGTPVSTRCVHTARSCRAFTVMVSSHSDQASCCFESGHRCCEEVDRMLSTLHRQLTASPGKSHGPGLEPYVRVRDL